MRKTCTLPFLFLLCLGVVRANAAPATLTYQGRILKTDGSPLEYSSVSFQFEVLAPNKTCVLYREQLNHVDMTNSSGVFDATIGNSHSYPAAPTFTILDAFNNGLSQTCDGNSPYNPGLTDGRFLRVKFHDGNSWKTISPDNEIRTVPYSGFSASAAMLGSNVATDFVLKTEVNNNINCDSGNFLTWDASARKFGCSGVSGASGGTVKTVTASAGSNPYLTVNADTVNPVVTLNVGTIAGTVAAGNDSRFSDARTPTGAAGGVLTGTYPNPGLADNSVINSKIADAAVSTAKLFANPGVNRLVGTDSSTGSTLSPIVCSSGQLLTWNVATGWQCTNQSSLAVGSASLATNFSGNLAGDVTGTQGVTSVDKIKGYPLNFTVAPSNGQILKFNGTEWAPSADNSAPTGAAGGDLTGTYPNPTLAAIVTASTGTKITYDAKGRVTASASLSATDIPALDWSKITSGKPTSLSGYGITDSVLNAGGTPSIQTGTDASKPGSPSAGAIYFATDTKIIYQFNSGAWVAIATSTGSGGTISSLTSDVSASGSGAVSATVNSVGGSTAANIHNAELAANAATNANTFSAIVKRDAAGDFAASNVTLNSVILKDSGTKTATLQAPTTITTSYVLKLPAALGAANQVLTTDALGNLSWTTPAVTSGVTVTSPITNSGTAAAPNIGIQQANGSQNGYLSSADWTTFNAKLGAINNSASLASGKIWVGDGSGKSQEQTPSGDVTMTNAGAFTVAKIQSTAVSATTPTGAGQVLRYNGTTQYVPAFLNIADIKASITPFGGAFASAACAANKTMYYDAPTDTFLCQNISVAATNFANQAQNSFLAGPSTGGAGAPTFRSISAADLPITGAGGAWVNGGNSFGAIATMGTNDAFNLGLETNGSTRMTIDSSGNVGIGTAAPTTKLEVNGDAKFTGVGGVTVNWGVNAAKFVSDQISYAAAYTSSSASYDAPPQGDANGIYLKLANTSGSTGTGTFLHFQSKNSTSAVQKAYIGSVSVAAGDSAAVVIGRKSGATAYQESMRISEAGNIGIGTSSPSHLLHIVSATTNSGVALNAATGTNSYVDFQEAGTKKANIYLKGSDDTLQINDIGTTNTIINGMGGNVGIGTAAPSEALEVTGNVKAASYLYTSDARLKKDIITLPDALAKVLQLRGVNFVWKSNDEKTVGFIAQEVEKIYPELVKTDKKTGYKAVQYGNIVAILVEALKQEHQERLQAETRCESQVQNVQRSVASVQDNSQTRLNKLEKENQDLKLRLERLEKILSEK